jgi:YD repeat-containing protein
VQRYVGGGGDDDYLLNLPPRIAGSYSGPPLERVTVYGYDGEGNLTDIIEPERRWARRVVTDFGPPGSNGENLDPLDDMTYEYTFAGLTSYQPPSNNSNSGTYLCLDGGTIGIHYGKVIAGQPAETLHVRYLQPVPIALTPQNRPQAGGDYETLRGTRYALDGSGRPIEADNLQLVNGVLREEGGRSINDLGEVYRVRDYTGNVNRWTRNYLGMRFRRYEGTLDTYWGNEGYQVLSGAVDHDFDQDHGVDFTGYDMVLKELNRFGESPRDIRQPIEQWRFLSDHRGSWAHVEGSGAGYHNPPSPTHLADAEDDAYLTRFGYDWSMRRVREDIHDLPAVGTQLQDSDRQRTILHYYDYAGREAMTVVFGPLIPSDISVVDPALLGPDAVLPSADEFLALNPRPLSITTRVYDNADRIVETREYDVASPVGQEGRFTRSLAYHGFKDQQVFTLDSGAPAVATYLDALGRPVVITELTTSSAGNWSVELSREDLTLNDRGQVLEQVSWERVNSIGATLGTTNAVSTTTWNWYDHSGRLTATAELGTGTASYLAPSQLPTGYADVDAPQLTSLGLVVTIDSELASARVTIHEYNEAGRIIATRHPDGTIDTFAYEGNRPLATTYNASATSSDLTRTTAQGRTDGKVTSIRAVDTLANIDTQLPTAHGWMSQQFGAPVLDRDFQIQSFDRTRPSRMGRTFDVDPESPVAASNFEFEFAYDFLGRLAQRTARDGTVTRYTYDVFDEIRTIEIGRLDAGQFTPGYPATSGIAAADRIGFVEFASTWSVGENKEPIEVRDVIARVAREDPAGGPGRVVSHVQQHFDGRGNLVREYQSIGALVNADSPCIEYEWEFVTAISSLDTGFSRLSAIKYPDFFASGRRTVSIDYGSPGSITNNFNLAYGVTTNVDAGPGVDVLKSTYQSTARRFSAQSSQLRLDIHSGNATVVGFDRVDSFGDLAITAYESENAYGQVTPLYTAHYHRDALARVVAVRTSYHNSFNNTRSSGHRYDPLGRLAESAIGALSFSPGDPANWSMTTSYRADAWHMDRLDNWNRVDPNNSALYGHVTVGNFDTDPAAETAFFHYDTTASSDLDLLMHGLDGSVDPPVQVQRDPLGRVLFDGIYFYGYDAWGRLTQINLAEPIGNDQYQQGELVRHFVYDGLGRTIRVQRAAEGVMDDPGVSYVSSEFIFYDGMRRIADVLAAPVYDKYSALVTGGESGENQEESKQEAGHFVDGKTANTGFEHLELGDTTYLQVHREYVWDPDPDYSPFGGVDTLVAYFDGADRDKPWYVIQSQQGDPVAIVECDTTAHVASVVWRAAFEPYGSVAWASNATYDPFPRLAMGHKGLFVERLDAPPVVWFDSDDERLAPEADLLVLMRNRQYLPRLGRFLQPDPNATGVAVQPSLAYGGSALPTPDPYVDLHSWAADGTSALAYALSDPVNGADPTGLSLLGLLGTTAMRGLELVGPDFGGILQSVAQELTDEYAMRQEYDAAWAMEWGAGDDWHTRLDSWWVDAAIGRGIYKGFEVGIPFTDIGFNPMDIVPGAGDAMARRSSSGPAGGGLEFGVDVVRKFAGQSGQLHHIATIYGEKGLRLQILFRKNGLELNSPENAMKLANHRGRHLAAYHNEVIRRLERAHLRGRAAFKEELEDIADDIRGGRLRPNNFDVNVPPI